MSAVPTQAKKVAVAIEPLWEFDAPKIFDFVKMSDEEGIDAWFGT